VFGGAKANPDNEKQDMLYPNVAKVEGAANPRRKG